MVDVIVLNIPIGRLKKLKPTRVLKPSKRNLIITIFFEEQTNSIGATYYDQRLPWFDPQPWKNFTVEMNQRGIEHRTQIIYAQKKIKYEKKSLMLLFCQCSNSTLLLLSKWAIPGLFLITFRAKLTQLKLQTLEGFELGSSEKKASRLTTCPSPRPKSTLFCQFVSNQLFVRILNLILITLLL